MPDQYFVHWLSKETLLSTFLLSEDNNKLEDV